MATRWSGFEDSLLCPVCRDVFREPVLLLCSHSFCWSCLQRFWHLSGVQTCPVCRSDSPLQRPPCNRALKELCELFQRDADLRETRTSTSVREEDGVKQEEPSSVTSLQEKMTALHLQKFVLRQREEQLKDSANLTAARVRQQLQRLRVFLQQQQKESLMKLRKEEEQKTKIITQQIHKIKSEIAFLTDFQSDDITLLQNSEVNGDLRKKLFTFSVLIHTSSLLRPPPDALINEKEHLTNLKLNVCQKMRNLLQNYPVLLDPDSAHPCIHISECQSSMRLGEWTPPAPGRPQQLSVSGSTSVLGSEAFGSGVQHWDVEVGRNSSWALGVISESAVQSGLSPSSDGLWRFAFNHGMYGQGDSGEFLSPLPLTRPVQTVRVLLDCNRGTLSFSCALTHTHLHTFTHCFSEKVLPYFCTACPLEPLRLLPE